MSLLDIHQKMLAKSVISDPVETYMYSEVYETLQNEVISRGSYHLMVATP